MFLANRKKPVHRAVYTHTHTYTHRNKSTISLGVDGQGSISTLCLRWQLQTIIFFLVDGHQQRAHIRFIPDSRWGREALSLCRPPGVSDPLHTAVAVSHHLASLGLEALVASGADPGHRELLNGIARVLPVCSHALHEILHTWLPVAVY